MFRFSLVSCACLVFAGQSHASWADGLFEELSRDFGAVPRGHMLSHPFRVVNNTKETITISGVRVSCGKCSSARALQTIIPPGGETAIIVNMNTNMFAGHKDITCFVTFSRPQFHEVRLLVVANSRDDIALTPESLNFGQVKRGKEAAATAQLTFYGNATTQVLEARSDSNYVQATIEEVRRDGSEVVYKVTGQVRPDTPAGKWFTDVWLKTNNPVFPKLRIPVSVEIESALAVTPSTVALGKVKAGTETERKVILRGVQPFRILKIAGTDKQFQVRPATEESKNVHVLNVTLSPNEVGDLSRIIRIQTDLKSQSSIEFNAQAEIVP